MESRVDSINASTLVEDPLNLRAPAIVVAHQVVDGPGDVRVAALFARLVLVGDVGAVDAALPHQAAADAPWTRW